MKLRVNDPCPCGSGKKYKKCCLSKRNETPPSSALAELNPTFAMGVELNRTLSRMLGTESTSVPDTPSELQSIPGQAISLIRTLDSQLSALESIVSAQTGRPVPRLLSWESLGDKKRHRFIPREETEAYFTTQHKAFYDTILSHVTKKTPHDLETVLQMLDTVPPDEQYMFGWMVAARCFCLQQQGRKEESLWCHIEVLLRYPDAKSWYICGHWMLQWLQSFPNSPKRSYVLDSLRQQCTTLDLAPLQLALATGLCQEGSTLPSDEAVPFYRLALQPERWPWISGKSTPPSRKSTPAQRDTNNWLGAFSVGLIRMLTYSHQQQDPEQIRNYTKICHRVPWGQLSPETCEKIFGILCEGFFRIQHVEPVHNFVKLFKEWIPHRPILDFWAGRAYWNKAQFKPAAQAFLNALKSPQLLADFHLCNMVVFFLSQSSPDPMRLALNAHREKDAFHHLRLEYWYHTLIGDYQTALSWVERFLEQCPDDFEHSCHRLSTLEQLNRIEQMEAELRIRLASSHEPTRQHAHIALASLKNNQKQYEEALTLLKSVPETPDPRVFLNNPSIRSGYYVLWADVLEQTTPEADIERYLRLAIQILPDTWNLTRLLIHYCRLKRWDDAQQLLPQITALGGESFYTQRAYLHIAFHHNNLAEARSILESMGRQAFEEHQAFEIWLGSWIQLLHESADSCAFLDFTEEHLDAILANPGLRDIRKLVIQDITRRYRSLLDSHHQLEQRLGQQHHTEQQQVSELRLQLEQTIAKNQRFQESFQRALRDHQSLQSRMSALHQQATQHEWFATTLQNAQDILASFEQQHSSLLANLSPEARHYLLEAERLWHQTIPTSINDYAPFTIQYARTLEREINLKLIDPLVAWTLAQGGNLSDFPVANSLALKPRQNNLSLGDAAKMLYHRIVYTDDRGNSVIQRNPASFPAHQNILRHFWNKAASLSSDPDSRTRRVTELTPSIVGDVPADASFILDLLEFIQLRNRASHARDATHSESSTHILTKQEAERIRHLTLGDLKSPGLLARILQFHHAVFEPHTGHQPE